MILVLNAGNSNIALGIYEQDRLKHHWRMETNRHKTEDEYAMQVRAFLHMYNYPLKILKASLFPLLCRQSCMY